MGKLKSRAEPGFFMAALRRVPARWAVR